MFEITTYLAETMGTHGTGFTEYLHEKDAISTPDEEVALALYSVILKVLRPSLSANWAAYFGWLLNDIQKISFAEFKANAHDAEREAMADICGISRLDAVTISVAGAQMCAFDHNRNYTWDEIRTRIFEVLQKLASFYVK